MTDTKNTKKKHAHKASGSSKLTEKMRTTLNAIIQLLCDDLPASHKCTVIPSKNSDLFMLKHNDASLEKSILLHNITPGMLLINQDRLKGFIVTCISNLKKKHLLKKKVSYKISVYDDMITAPLINNLTKNYPLLSEETIARAVRSLYRFSISNCEEFPVRELAYRIHSSNPYVLAEGIDAIAITKDGVKGVMRNLDKYLIYEDVLHDGVLIALGNIKMQPGLNQELTINEKVLKDLYIVATRVLRTTQYEEAMKLCMVETASRARATDYIQTDMEVALNKVFG